MTEVPTPPAVPVPPAPADAGDTALWAVAQPLVNHAHFGQGIPGKLKRALQRWAAAKGLA